MLEPLILGLTNKSLLKFLLKKSVFLQNNNNNNNNNTLKIITTHCNEAINLQRLVKKIDNRGT